VLQSLFEVLEVVGQHDLLTLVVLILVIDVVCILLAGPRRGKK
jgi:hypothetical protein